MNALLFVCPFLSVCLFVCPYFQFRAHEKIAQICLMPLDSIRFLLEVDFFPHLSFILFIFDNFIVPQLRGPVSSPYPYNFCQQTARIVLVLLLVVWPYSLPLQILRFMEMPCFLVFTEDIICGIFLLLVRLIFFDF